MRILQVINNLETGGAEKLVMGLHRRYLQLGHDSVLLALAGSERGWTDRGVYSPGLGSPYCPMALTSLLDLRGPADPSSFDVVHSHLFPSQLVVAALSESVPLGGSLVTTEHSTSNRRRSSLPGKLVDRWTYRRYGRIVCVSPAAAAELCRWLPELEGRIEVVHNGIDLDAFSAVRPERESGTVTVLSVGRLTEAKNYHRAIEAFSLLMSRCEEDLYYLIAGGGGLEKSLRSHAAALGVSDRVRFLGEVDDVPALMRRADVFFMPSSREGFGLAAVEAMASGLPVVASRLPGIGDVVGDDGSCGILADPGSAEQMADGLLELVQNGFLRQKKAEAGRKRAEFFSIEKTAERYLRLYRSVSGGRTE